MIIMPTTISFNGKSNELRESEMIDCLALQRFSPYVIPLMNTLQLCSIYYTVAVSLDRFLYLSYGLQAETICTVRNALRAIALITVSSALFILPHWFKHRVVFMENNRIQLKRK